MTDLLWLSLWLMAAPATDPMLMEQPVAASPAGAAFTKLSALQGEWRPADRPKSPLRIRFYLTAGGTVLVEEWTANGAPHSLTVYHRDGEGLLATHYCPQGNQPRLALMPSPQGQNRLSFTFRDATGLDTGESVQHDLAFDLGDPARIVRSETYRQGETDETSELVLVRVQTGA